MYDYIKGNLTKITAKYIVLEAGGLGYVINVVLYLLVDNPLRFGRLNER